MALTALRGALGFLSRLPVGRDGDAWEAFRGTPASFPFAGYVLGVILAVPLLVPAPDPTVAVAFVAGVYLLTGVTHVDGVADLADAAAVHGDPDARREVLKDAAIGASGALAVALVVLGLAGAGLALTALPPKGALLVIVGEVGAKGGMALLVCLGSAPHEGLGSAFTERASPRALVPVVAVCLPVAVVSWPRIAPGLVALLAAFLVALTVYGFAGRLIGGVNGDVLGAANEFARIAALHAGVMAWTLS